MFGNDPKRVGEVPQVLRPEALEAGWIDPENPPGRSSKSESQRYGISEQMSILFNKNFPTLRDMTVNFILYVLDQEQATRFYSAVLAQEPSLDVPGMTEFKLAENSTLGLMPAAGIKRLLGEALPDPSQAGGIPRAEIYLTVEDAAAYHRRALASGAKELSPLLPRDWGDTAAYSLDPDGHVLAFAFRDPTPPSPA